MWICIAHNRGTSNALAIANATPQSWWIPNVLQKSVHLHSDLRWLAAELEPVWQAWVLLKVESVNHSPSGSRDNEAASGHGFVMAETWKAADFHRWDMCRHFHSRTSHCLAHSARMECLSTQFHTHNTILVTTTYFYTCFFQSLDQSVSAQALDK